MAYTYKQLNIKESELEDTLNSYSQQGWELDKRELIMGTSPRTYNVLLRSGSSAAPDGSINFDPNTGEVYGNE